MRRRHNISRPRIPVPVGYLTVYGSGGIPVISCTTVNKSSRVALYDERGNSQRVNESFGIVWRMGKGCTGAMASSVVAFSSPRLALLILQLTQPSRHKPRRRSIVKPPTASPKFDISNPRSKSFVRANVVPCPRHNPFLVRHRPKSTASERPSASMAGSASQSFPSHAAAETHNSRR